MDAGFVFVFLLGKPNTSILHVIDFWLFGDVVTYSSMADLPTDVVNFYLRSLCKIKKMSAYLSLANLLFCKILIDWHNWLIAICKCRIEKSMYSKRLYPEFPRIVVNEISFILTNSWYPHTTLVDPEQSLVDVLYLNILEFLYISNHRLKNYHFEDTRRIPRLMYNKRY